MAHRLDSELTPGELERREYQRAYRAKNKAKLVAYHHDQYVQNKGVRSVYARRYYRQHAETYKERARQQRIVHRERFKAYWRERKTGCSAELYAWLLAKQDGKCAICGGVDARQLCADHDHDTGVVRGLLCRNCNLGIGNLQHNLEILRQAIAYLRRKIRS